MKIVRILLLIGLSGCAMSVEEAEYRREYLETKEFLDRQTQEIGQRNLRASAETGKVILLRDARKKCSDFGFKKETPPFSQCVMQIIQAHDIEQQRLMNDFQLMIIKNKLR